MALSDLGGTRHGRPALRWTTTVPWVALTHPTQVALNDEIRWRLIAIFSGAQRSKYSFSTIKDVRYWA